MTTTQQPEALSPEEFRAKVTRAAREPLLARIAELEDVADMAIKRIAELDARDAAFEAVRKAFCNLQRYSFWLDSRGNVRRCADRSGNWVEFEAAHTLFEPQSVDAALAAQAKQGGV